MFKETMRALRVSWFWLIGSFLHLMARGFRFLGEALEPMEAFLEKRVYTFFYARFTRFFFKCKLYFHVYNDKITAESFSTESLRWLILASWCKSWVIGVLLITRGCFKNALGLYTRSALFLAKSNALVEVGGDL